MRQLPSDSFQWDNSFTSFRFMLTCWVALLCSSRSGNSGTPRTTADSLLPLVSLVLLQCFRHQHVTGNSRHVGTFGHRNSTAADATAMGMLEWMKGGGESSVMSSRQGSVMGPDDDQSLLSEGGVQWLAPAPTQDDSHPTPPPAVALLAASGICPAQHPFQPRRKNWEPAATSSRSVQQQGLLSPLLNPSTPHQPPTRILPPSLSVSPHPGLGSLPAEASAHALFHPEHEEARYIQRRIRDNPMWTLDRGTGFYVQERISKKKASLLGSGK